MLMDWIGFFCCWSPNCQSNMQVVDACWLGVLFIRSIFNNPRSSSSRHQNFRQLPPQNYCKFSPKMIIFFLLLIIVNLLASSIHGNNYFAQNGGDNDYPTEWPSSNDATSYSGLHSKSAPSSPFLQAESPNLPAWHVSYSPVNQQQQQPNNDNDGQQVRPYRRYISNVPPQFAQPPDPHSSTNLLKWSQKQREPQGNVAEAFHGPPPLQVPQALRNYFSLDAQPEKVVKELMGVDLRSILGRTLLDQFVESTTAQTWTRATTPKDKLVQYFERSLDNFLTGRFRPMERTPYLLEKEKLLAMESQKNATGKKENDDAAEGGLMEGSGEADDEPVQSPLKEEEGKFVKSSIAGIPTEMPFIPRIPIEFFNNDGNGKQRQDIPLPAMLLAKKLAEVKRKPSAEGIEIRRHPTITIAGNEDGYGKDEGGGGGGSEGIVVEREEIMGNDNLPPVAKTMQDYYQYGTKPSYQQGVLGSVLNFFGINSPAGGTTVELDQVLTDWLMEHAPKDLTKLERKANRDSSYNIMKQLLSQPVVPLCTPKPEIIAKFDIDAFMGQWFEVMYSPLMSSKFSCTTLSYRMLNKTSSSNQPNSIGSIFQTLQISTPKQGQLAEEEYPQLDMPGTKGSTFDGLPQLSSGYAIVSRPGQMIFRKSNSLDEVIVHVIDAGYSPGGQRYEWAILGINCNYPIYVIARDPLAFKKKYEKLVIMTLERKGLISEVSRLLNLVKAINPEQCQTPKNLFN